MTKDLFVYYNFGRLIAFKPTERGQEVVNIFEELILIDNHDGQLAYWWRVAFKHVPDQLEQLIKAIEKIGLGLEVASTLYFLASQQLREDERSDLLSENADTNERNFFVDLLREGSYRLSDTGLLGRWRWTLKSHTGKRLMLLLEAIETTDIKIVAHAILFFAAHLPER